MIFLQYTPRYYFGLGLNCLFEVVQQTVPELRLLESVDSHYSFFFFTGLWLTSTAKTRNCNQKRINLTSRWLTLLQNKTFSIFISIKKPSDTRGDGREYAGKRSIPYAVQAYMCMEKKRPLNSPEQFLETVWHWEMLWRLCSLTLILMNAN